MRLFPGTKLETVLGEEVEVLRLLGEGGTGWVYEIRHGDAVKSMKLFRPTDAAATKRRYDQLKSMVVAGPPGKEFLWPEDLIAPDGTSFGYVEPLIPEGYREMDRFLRGQTEFSDEKLLYRGALNLVKAFHKIHLRGRCFADVNPMDLWFHPATGDVFITGCDQVIPDGIAVAVMGMPRYSAPEVVRAEARHSRNTDLYTLAVLLFVLLTRTHPLEGKRYLEDPLTIRMELALYGTDPVFILDPDDDRNRPVAGVHRDIGQIWPRLPEELRSLFLRAFSREALQNPPARVPTYAWAKVLTPLAEAGTETETP